MADWLMQGPYMKNCNCDPGCPCDFNANPTHGNCEGMAAMIVEQGHFDDVSLDGAKWAFKYWWPGALHEGHGAGQPILDSSCTPEQMNALGAILSGENGGTFFGILASIIDTVHDPVVADIDVDIDVAGRRAHCTVGDALHTETAPIQSMGEEVSDYAIEVKIPGGFEYEEAEIALATVLQGTGPIAFDHANAHSSLARVVRTPDN
ncbi:MAG TPA: DUF1326 domain-containing protein [Solirubrobacteraceae bacterium]|jgi:hypothetical protein|nr:DUF1326 domain-containing protein [Solirubrobacteraceae bacterium]